MSGRRGGIGGTAFSCFGGGGGGLLRCPVVDVPVVFVEEEVVLAELGVCHAGEVDGCEGGEEEVGFKCSPFSALV